MSRVGVLAILLVVWVGLVTAYGVADDLGLLGDPPAHARPAPPTRAARAEIPAGYLHLYRQAAGRCPGLSWGVLAGIGKVESDHGRARLPGVTSGDNHAGAAGPMQFGVGVGVGRAGNAWARYGADYDHDGHTSVYDPGDAIPAAARYLCAYGAPQNLDRALHAYNPSWSYVARVKRLARHYAARPSGGGRR